MINPWLAPPGNTWETTDIWVDSPVNGFGVYRYGMWDDGFGQMVPIGNGDDPAVGLVNRVYARIRNVGNATASDVVVTIEVTDPLGMGITGSWLQLGKVDKTNFPQLASIPAGGTTDVYVEWTPKVTLTAAQLAAGVFYFHSCLRVRIDPVVGETVLANQDGDREQENISYFQVPPSGPKPPHKHTISLRNRDTAHDEKVVLTYRLVGPRGGASDWRVQLNGGVTALTLAPGEVREIPVEIIPGKTTNKAGQKYSVDVFGLVRHELVNALDKNDIHNEFQVVGGARVEAMIVEPTRLSCVATVGKGGVSVSGRIGFPRTGKEQAPELPVLASAWTAKRGIAPASQILLKPDRNGKFHGFFRESERVHIDRVDCMFAGTTQVASAIQRVRVSRK